MVHYIALYRLSKGTTEEQIEEMIRVSRSCFRRLNEAHNFRSGRNLEAKGEFGFFISADFESRDKLAMFREDKAYARFDEEVVQAHASGCEEHLFETDPGVDPKYS